MRNKLLLAILLLTGVPAAEAVPGLATTPVRVSDAAAVISADGVVEAVRQTVLAAQVAGTITELRVKPGDRVKTGQVLARIDARAADQSAAASQAQVQAARATQEVATKDFDRQKLLRQKGFISQAALDQAEAVYKASEAQVNAQIAQAGAARAQTDFFTLRAPYDGIVADVPVVQGDMAMPGRAIATVYDPADLRITATISPTADPSALSAPAAQGIKIELMGTMRKWVVPTRVTPIPTADPATHTMQIRLDLPAGTTGVTPGTFARVWLPVRDGAGASRLYVPTGAIVRRAEMTALYVVDANGKPALRQVRLGRATEDSTEVLTGIAAGERIATDPQAAAMVR